MNKQAVCIVKNCNDNIFEETAIKCCNSTALIKKTAWIVAWKLKNSHILVECVTEIVENDDVSALEKEAAETVKNNDINILDEETAWMIVTVLRNSHILVKNAVKIVKNSSISVLEKKAAEVVKNHNISVFDKEVTFIFNE